MDLHHIAHTAYVQGVCSADMVNHLSYQVSSKVFVLLRKYVPLLLAYI